MAKKKNKKQKTTIYKGFSCKLVDKWVAPEDGGAPILTMPNVPHPLHTCLMPDAEVLTPHGWKRIDSVEIGDTVACWSEDGVLFDQVQDTVKTYCTHNYKIGFDKAKNFDMVYSPSHRIPLYYEEHYHGRKKEKLPEPKMNFFVRTAEEFCPNSHTHFITASNSLCKENHLTNEERVFIAIQADGSLKRDNKTDRTYCLKFVKPRKTQRMMELLKESSLKWTYNKTSGVDVFHVRTDKKDYKCFDGIFNIAEFSYEKAREFINETTLWDGHNGKLLFGTNREYYCSTNYENVGFVQAVAMLGGFTTTTHTRPATDKTAECKTVWFMDKLYRSAGHVKKQIQLYNDFMYCITVPTSFFVVRYHDVVMVTGNCAPRTILGATTWNHMRNRCYYEANYQCEICGAKVKTEFYENGAVHHQYHDDGTIPKRALHSHELYTYDYEKGTAKFERCIAACEACHVRFIHSGRMFTMYKKGDPLMTSERVLDGIERGFKQIYEYNKEHKGSEKLRVYYTIIDYVDDPVLGEKIWDLIDKYEIEFYMPNGEMYPFGCSVWEGWKLLIGNKEYPSPFHSQKDWEDAMAKNNEVQLKKRNAWMDRFKKFDDIYSVDISDDDMKKINDAVIPEGF